MRKMSRKNDVNVGFLTFFQTSYLEWCVSHNNGKNNSDKNNVNARHKFKYCSVHLQDIFSHINTIAHLNTLCGDGFAKFDCKCKYERCQMKNVFFCSEQNCYDCV